MMRRFLSRSASRIGRTILEISKKLEQPSSEGELTSDPKEEMVTSWYKDRGDETLRLDYDLDENSVVFDLGGYEGQWSSDIFSRYCCSVHVFEPVEDYANRIKRRFSKNKRIFVHQYGLGGKNDNVKIAVERDGSSIFKSAKEVADCRLVKATDFMLDRGVTSVDLMKINIEGGEYDLLEHLIVSGFVKNIKNIQIQFHDCVPNAEQHMLRIQKDLERTHSLTYQYRFVWENWRIKSIAY